jgi:hypothetical protein
MPFKLNLRRYSKGPAEEKVAAEEDAAPAEPEISEEERESAEAEILQAEIFGRIAAMLSETDQEVQAVGAMALSVYTVGPGAR